jgi:hypothetical protein
VVARLTRWLKREAPRIEDWRALDPFYSVGEFQLQLYGWERPRRFVVIRERLQENKDSMGRKLLDVPGYTFRLLVTNREEVPELIWRDYNQRADVSLVAVAQLVIRFKGSHATAYLFSFSDLGFFFFFFFPFPLVSASSLVTLFEVFESASSDFAERFLVTPDLEASFTTAFSMLIPVL